MNNYAQNWIRLGSLVGDSSSIARILDLDCVSKHSRSLVNLSVLFSSCRFCMFWT